MKKLYILTIVSIGLFIGFWFGYYVFAQVYVKVVCRPSGRVLLDARRSLLYEITLNINVAGCESIDFVIEKANVQDIIFGGGPTEISPEQSTPSESTSGTQGQLPSQSSGPSEGTTEEEEPPPGVEVPTPPGTEEPTLRLEIFDMCSADTAIGDYPEVSYCLGLKSPYYVILQKNNSTITTSFYGGIGYTKTYSFSDPTPIFQIFVHDLYTLSENVEGIEMYGSNASYFSIGTYIERDVLEPETERLSVQKSMKNVRALIFPLYVNDSIPSYSNWDQLNFYLRTDQNLYPIGDLWFYSA